MARPGSRSSAKPFQPAARSRPRQIRARKLSFGGETIGRLGANTVFKFNGGSRKLQLGEGVLLVHAPKNGGRCEIQLGGVSAAVTNCTVVSELHSGPSAASFKLLVLNGTARLYRPGHWGDSVLVRPGQMVIGNPAQPVSDPVDVDVPRFVKTCRLINDFGPVGSEKLLAKEGEKQARAKGKRALIDTNLVIFGEGSLVTLTNPDPAAAPDNAGQTEPGPQPSRGPTVSLQSPRIDNKATAIAR